LVEKNEITFGNFKNGLLHGKCIHINANGSKADFNYKEGVKDGLCVMINKRLDGVREVYVNGELESSQYIEATLLNIVILETFQGHAVQTPIRMML
jgi:antitoxin component YwqK of YwqJK toxin-antitoxin module